CEPAAASDSDRIGPGKPAFPPHRARIGSAGSGGHHRAAVKQPLFPFRSLSIAAMTAIPASSSAGAMPATTAARLNRVDHLLILRGFACLLVVAMHALGHLPAEQRGTLGRMGPIDLNWVLYAPGWAGV